MENNEIPEITRKLGEISRIMSDGYYFMRIRVQVEEWQKMADTDDVKAQAAIKMIEQFYRLCTILEKT